MCLIIVGVFFINRKQMVQNNIAKYHDNIAQGDSLAALDYINHNNAIARYEEAKTLESYVSEIDKVDLNDKIAPLRKGIDSVFFKLVRDAEAFAVLNTLAGNNIASEKYERALQLKENDIIRLKLEEIQKREN